MGNIYQYELRRLLWNKLFLGLAVVILFYGSQVFLGQTLLGVAHTAPFSPWSFGLYLSRLLPLLWVGELFFLLYFTAGHARRVAVLTAATPVDPRRYARTRCAAALTASAVLAGLAVLLPAILYSLLFGFSRWGTLVLPALVTLLPPMLLALGSGWLLGQIRSWLLYLWMLVPFLLAALPLPRALSLWNGSLFSELPLSLGTLDPAFQLPASVWAVQAAVLVLGALLIHFAGKRR